MTFFEQYDEFDPFTRSPEPSNPWISDSTEYWEQEQNMLVAIRALVFCCVLLPPRYSLLYFYYDKKGMGA